MEAVCDLEKIMSLFEQKRITLFNEIGECKKMVLSTSFEDYVTSRMMSIIIYDGIFYFQTDKTFKKYEQLQKNRKVALCIDNISVEGYSKELGHPMENSDFCNLYKNYFPSAYNRYTQLANERLFSIEPIIIKKWIYEEDEPYEEVFDFVGKIYEKRKYLRKGE